MKMPQRRLPSSLAAALAASLGALSAPALAQHEPAAWPPYAAPAPVMYYYPGVPYGSGAAPGAAIGSLVGAAAGPNPGSIFLGALLGGIIGHAATTPPLAPVGAPYYSARPDPAFTGVSRFPAVPAATPVDASPFIDHWQRFAEPYAKPR